MNRKDIINSMLSEYSLDKINSYFEKLNEVYQWRNGVFSLSRDFLKIKPVQDAARLGLPPSEGGLLNSVRVVPYYFSFGALPVR